MGRKKKVDRNTAQEAALSAFWANGYTGLGVRRLEELTGINRFALQTEFGGKNGLFLDISKLYVSSWKRTYRDAIRNGNLDSLAEYFLLRASTNLPAESNNGCLLFNTLSDEQLDAPDIRKVVSDFLQTIQQSFACALHNERAQGTLIEDLDINGASQLLLSSLIGMNILIKARQSNKAALPTALALQKTILAWRILA